MEPKVKKIIVPPTGYINDIAKIVGCNRNTVWRALRKNAKGALADRCRLVYLAKYGNR